MMRKLAAGPVHYPFKIYNYAVIPSHFPQFPYHLQSCANLRGRSCFIIGMCSQLVIIFCRDRKSILRALFHDRRANKLYRTRCDANRHFLRRVCFAEIVTITVMLNRYTDQRGFQVHLASGTQRVSSYGFCAKGGVRAFLSRETIAKGWPDC